MSLAGYALDGEVLAGLMFAVALLLLWIGLDRRPPKPAPRPEEAPVKRDRDPRPPSPEGPRGPWG